MVKELNLQSTSQLLPSSPNTSTDSKLSKDTGKYKTELCRTWVEHNYCPYKEKCRFAHGKKDLHEKIVIGKNYKQKECNSFYTKGYCPYGPRCHFKHDERKLWEIERIYYQLVLFSPRTAARAKRLGVLEGIVSGEAGANKANCDERLQQRSHFVKLNFFQNNLPIARIF
jgi:hypothetical protein